MRRESRLPVDPARSEEIHQRVSASLGAASAATLAAVLAAEVGEPACYEASIRVDAEGRPSAGRMMIEQATPRVIDAIAAALAVDLPPAVPRWLAAARREGVPVIVGWDRRGDGAERCVKLYVNASDAGPAPRARLSATLLPELRSAAPPAAVVGMNARADGVVETKVYTQSSDARALAFGLEERGRALAEAAIADGAAAGAVLSSDVEGPVLRPRAFFVALREPREGGWPCLRSLPGYDPGSFAALWPFAPAPPRSVGVSLGDTSWTLYCKPRDSGRAPEALEPVAVFRAGGDCEVGVFVEPNENAPRAFRRTERHAVSVRVRDGDPAPRALESLVDWFTAELRDAERKGSPRLPPFASPPAPWRVVAAASAVTEGGV